MNDGQGGLSAVSENSEETLSRTGTAAAVTSQESDSGAYLFPQTRALEVRLPEDFDGEEAKRLVWLVQRAGFNTILLTCFSGGQTLYPSPVMSAYGFPAQDRQFRGSDPLKDLLRAARHEGVVVYALVECLNVGTADRHSTIARNRPDWTVRGRAAPDGRGNPPFLCPVNREVWRFLGDLIYEILEVYGFQGVYLRHLHFPLEHAENRLDFCRCDTCRRAVWLSLGVAIEKVPEDPDHPDRYNVTAWRVKQLENLIRYLRLRLNKACTRGLTLAEVYLCDEEGLHPEHNGYQSVGDWIEEGLISIAAARPRLDRSPEVDERWIGCLSALTQKALVMPALSATPNAGLVQTVERMAIEPIAGVVVREPHDLTAPPLNQLPLGTWREPTQAAESRPLYSVCALTAETIRILPPDNPVRAFLSDVLRVCEPLGRQWPAPQRQTLAENLRGLEERIAAEKLDLGDAKSAVLRNFRLARQLLRLAESES